MDLLLKFVNGEPGSAAVLVTDAADRLFAFSRSVEKALTRFSRESLKRQTTLQARLDGIREKRNQQMEAGEFRCLEYDSLDLAKAITWSLKDAHHYTTKLKVNFILYHCYCKWLYRNGERLTLESPVAQEKGPWFWKVMSGLEIPTLPPKNWIDDIRALNPGLAEYLNNASVKYGQYNEEHLSQVYIQTRPYLNAHRDRNDGKWNRPINDRDIYAYEKNKHQ